MSNHRSERLRQAANGETCVNCGKCDGTIVWAHSNESMHGKGGAIKAHDLLGNFLCGDCHHAYDHGRTSREWCREMFREWYPKSMVRVAELIAAGKLKL